MDPRPTEQDPFVGRGIGPSYAAVRRIGAGGMGAVYEAKHRQTGRRVAIKVLNREMAQDPSLLERFRREARITASLVTPHVVKVLEFDQLPSGVPYMVMEYLEGEDLEGRLKRVKTLRPGEALELLRGATAALSEAHAAGVVHRDIKPGNLFYAREAGTERVKLLDFGISKASNLTGDGLTVFGQVLGTIWYMSPEQARGGELSTASDVWSLAVVLYEALCGQLPFEAGTPIEYLMKLQTDAPRSLIALAPELPLGLEAVFQRALAREPALRTADVASFAREVEDTFAMGSEQTSVRRPSDASFRPPPPPPPAPPKRVVTAGKMPVARSTDTTLPPNARTASDPRLRAAPPRPAAPSDEFGPTFVARKLTPPTPLEAQRHAHEPTTLDEDPPDHGAPPVLEEHDSTRVISAPTPALEEHDSTRVVPAPAVARPVTGETPPDVSDSTRVVPGPAPRRPDTMPTPPAEEHLDQGPTVLNMSAFDPDLESDPEPPTRPSAAAMRARPVVRSTSEVDHEAARFTPPMARRAAEPSNPEPFTAEHDAAEDDETLSGDAQPTLRRAPAQSGDGKIVVWGIALGLGLLLLAAGVFFVATHH